MRIKWKSRRLRVGEPTRLFVGTSSSWLCVSLTGRGFPYRTTIFALRWNPKSAKASNSPPPQSPTLRGMIRGVWGFLFTECIYTGRTSEKAIREKHVHVFLRSTIIRIVKRYIIYAYKIKTSNGTEDHNNNMYICMCMCACVCMCVI
jgi:hypothetical protein